MNRKCDIVIAGGGVIGCSIAYNLAKRGKKVILVEKNDHASGATGSCDQMVILQSKNPGIHLSLALASAEMFKVLEKELDCEVGCHNDGGMILIETADEMKVMEDFVARQKKIGLQVEILTRQEAVKRQKGLAEHILGATYSPQDGHVDPFKLNLAFARAASRLGAEILLGTEVTGLKTRNNKIAGVETSRGFIEAPIVINAAGAWASVIGRSAELELPITPRRGQIIISEPVPPYVNGDILSAQYIVAKYNPELIKKSSSKGVQLGVGLALSQTEKGNILIGATREFVGYNLQNTRDGIKEVLKNAARLVPGLKDINFIRVMSGLRPYTPDGLPLVGYVQELEGFFMAAGHEGDGIALAPVTGRIAADLICDGKTFIDVTALAPNRFNLNAQVVS